jgi:hypothetical protein
MRSISWILKSVEPSRVWYCISFAKKADTGPEVCLSQKNWARSIYGPAFASMEPSWVYRVVHICFGSVLA